MTRKPAQHSSLGMEDCRSFPQRLELLTYEATESDANSDRG